MTVEMPLPLAFINPGFALAGAALVSIPVIIHILNRRRYRIQPWAAMKFLLEAMRRNRRRVQFEQWLLLATRCLAMVLLGLALARPIGCADSTIAALAAQRAGLHVIIIDTSYSMQYVAERPDAKTHLDHAKKLARTLVERLSSGGESVAIVTAGRPATAVLAKPTFDLPAAIAVIERLEPYSGGTDLSGALHLALQIGNDEKKQPSRTLHLITDGTSSAFRGEAAGDLASVAREAAKLFRVFHYDVGKPGQWNQAVLNVAPAGGLVRQGFANDFVATVRGFGAARDARLIWKLDDEPLPGGASLRPDTQTPPIVQSGAQFRQGGPHTLTVQLVGEDRLPVDNTTTRVIDVASELKVLLVEGKREVGPLGGSAAFLRLALAPPSDGDVPGRSTLSYLAPEVISDLELPDKVLADYRAVVLADIASITATMADRLRQFVDQGGTLVIFAGEQLDAESYGSNLLSRSLIPGRLVKRVRVPEGGKPFAFDFKPAGNVHPFLHAFRGLTNSGLDTAEVFEYWQLELPADSKAQRVLDYLPATPNQPPDPAITLHSLGQGQVIFVSTTANAEWTSFPAKPAYVTLVHELLSRSVSGAERWLNVEVGRSLRLPASLGVTSVPTLLDPKQQPVLLEPTTDGTGAVIYVSGPLLTPGLHRLSTGSVSIPVAVVLPEDEADVTHLDETALKASLGDIDVELLGDSVPELAAAERDGQDYGWTIMLVLLALLGLECFMAMRFGHYRRGGKVTGGVA
jgi:hypothetical protein